MRKSEVKVLQGELRKLKPPTFDGEKSGEVTKMWLLEMKNYPRFHDYSDNQEAWIVIYNIEGKAYKWWKHLNKVKNLNERNISWRSFQKYFKKEYLSQQYYDKNMQEFFVPWLGNMTMKEYEKIFLEMLNYVNFIQEKILISRDYSMIYHNFTGI